MSTATEIRLATGPAWVVALLGLVERHVERRNREREARRTQLALEQLDPHTLRDIGLNASALSPIAATLGVDGTHPRLWSPHRHWF